ncbi:MAG TPA: SpoIIIAH-like family protein [Bacillota bacterium]|jgi:stage III sporulation protein AH|nr:SpoIIIAH-like family protein [Peptococcaceae bacterium MAG4]NLW38862.1 SpoIIIAH-like family protein [Peptococcaceae bacterium]HPU36273.1 SpoIIIAH-like family protein [Bacillota bacterium]HPZ42525.1 SpoIIIAH-like family protein [Bacillota bacterium]HQD76156.1 SpoIIIAH-like family protein [Bacillota bacterium]
MYPIIIRRRTLSLIALALIGAALLFLGWRGNLLEQRFTAPGTPVTSPSINETEPASTAQATGVAGQPGKMASASAPVEEQDFFVDYRLERDRIRGQRVEWLREVINNNNSTAETRQKAQEHLLAISRSMEKENELENLLRAKGFKDAAVFVDEDSVTVIVEPPSGKLASEDFSSITGLVSKGTGVDAQNIIIIPRGSE